MNLYADYGFYIESYNGDMQEDEFPKNMIMATGCLRSITLAKADKFSGDELKYAACEIADVYFSCSDKSSSDVKSENTDGYSVSYISERKDGETKEQFLSRKCYEIAKRWLRNTGLLYRKVGCSHAD